MRDDAALARSSGFMHACTQIQPPDTERFFAHTIIHAIVSRSDIVLAQAQSNQNLPGSVPLTCSAVPAWQRDGVHEASGPLGAAWSNPTYIADAGHAPPCLSGWADSIGGSTQRRTHAGSLPTPATAASSNDGVAGVHSERSMQLRNTILYFGGHVHHPP